MRIYGIEGNGRFRPYMMTPFQLDHDEADLEDWLEENCDAILDDDANVKAGNSVNLLIIGRQVNTNLNSTIDLLALDREGDVVVIELKRDRTPRDTLAQALEYASFAEQLDAGALEGILQSYMSDESLKLAEYHREYFAIEPEEAVAFNKSQHIVIVGQQITNGIRQTASFLCLKGIQVTCVEFSFFQADGGKKLLSQEIVVGNLPPRPQRLASASRTVISPDGFLKGLDNNGRPVFERLLSLAGQCSMPIHWGTKGFSLNVDLDGTHVLICCGYPPNSVFKQSIYTTLVGQGGFKSKCSVPDDVVRSLWENAKDTGLFYPAGQELRCPINRPFSEEEIGKLVLWIEGVAETITKFGLK